MPGGADAGAGSADRGTLPLGRAIELTTGQLADIGGTSLRYEDGQFMQNWKTSKTMAGACVLVAMTATDGSQIHACFQLK